MSRSLLAVLAGLILCSALARAEEEATTRIPLPHPVPDETYWYGVYQGRDKVGWAMQSLTRPGPGKDAPYVSQTIICGRLMGLAGPMDFRFSARDVFRGAPPFDLLASSELRDEGGRVRSIYVLRVGDAYVVDLEHDGTRERRELGPFDYTLADRLSHIHWIQQAPAVGDRIRVREFDLSDLVPDVYTYEVKGVRHEPARGIEITVYDVAMRSERKGSLGEALIGVRGRVLRGPLAGVAEMRLEAMEQAIDRARASDLFAYGNAPTTEALGDPRVVRHLELAVYGRNATVFRDDAGLRVQIEEATGDVLLTTGRDVGEAPRVEAADRVRALASDTTGTYPADDPNVRVLAASITEGAATDTGRVERLVAWVAEHVKDVHIPDPLPVRRLLQEPAGDAAEHARLFVTLARACGIPARPVRGLVYLGDTLQAFGGHTWCEVALEERWVGVDPTWGETTVDATHLPMRWADGFARLMGFVDALAFEIRSVERGN